MIPLATILARVVAVAANSDFKLVLSLSSSPTRLDPCLPQELWGAGSSGSEAPVFSRQPDFRYCIEVEYFFNNTHSNSRNHSCNSQFGYINLIDFVVYILFIDDVPMTDFLQASDLLTVRDPTDLSDSNDHSDSIDSESSSPDAASSSMCSMEQSYVFNPSKCSDDLTCSGTQPSEDHLFLDDDQEMLNPVGSSMYSSDDIPSFQVDESMRHQLFTSRKQLTSTLKLVPSNTSSVLSAIPTTSKSHLGLDGTHLDLDGSSPEPDGKFIHQKSVTLGGFPAASPRSKVIQREVTPMQADSGFNTQSFTSMEVTDSDVIDIMQTNEYSVDGYPMNDKETIRSNIMR